MATISNPSSVPRCQLLIGSEGCDAETSSSLPAGTGGVYEKPCIRVQAGAAVDEELGLELEMVISSSSRTSRLAASRGWGIPQTSTLRSLVISKTVFPCRIYYQTR